jgi:heparanase 1
MAGSGALSKADERTIIVSVAKALGLLYQAAMKTVARGSMLFVTLVACSTTDEPAPETIAQLSVDTAEAAATVDPRYLSVAVDMAQVVGGRFWSSSGQQEVIGEEDVPEYDFGRPRLRALASHLAPAFLRIGGSDSDRVIYDLSAQPIEVAPEGFEFVLTAAQLDGVFEFAEALDYDVMFTLNAGVGVRGESNAWTPEMATELIEYVVDNGYDVTLWELGNEWNLYAFILRLGLEVPQIVSDFEAASALVDELDPGSLFGGPSSAYYPTPGELLQEVYPAFMAMGGADTIDAITWHYYPQQSQRCLFAPDPYEPEGILNAAGLDRGVHWAEEVEAVRDARAPGMPIWLGETGHAQCGGQPDASDRFEGTFWWLDQLGALARRGHQIMVRQTLSGSNYGLIDDVTLDPRPDYWASVLWRRLMDERVLDVTRVTVDENVRLYAHCTHQKPGAVTVLAINLDPQHDVRLDIEGLEGGKDLYLLTADSLDSADLMLNGVVLRDEDGALPDLPPQSIGSRPADLPARSMAFVVFPDADAAACR